MLTDEQNMLKEAIESSVRLAGRLLAQIAEMKALCWGKFGHVVVTDVADGAHCAICSTDFGWYCPKSPDHVCHYETEIPDHDEGGIQDFERFRFVRLLDGTLHKLDKPTESESEDWCIFCGDPEERK